MTPDCNTCKAKTSCPVEVLPGSMICLVSLSNSGKTHADAETERLSCDGCQHEAKQANEMPCCNCIRFPKADHYVPEDTGED